MKTLTEISIDLDVYKHIKSNLLHLEESDNSVLRRLLGLDNGLTKKPEYEKNGLNEATTQKSRSGLWQKNIFLPEGLKLRKELKGVMHEATIRSGYIEYNNSKFNSLSAAGGAASKTSVNGWRFWEYLDERINSWYPLDDLRNGRSL